MKTKEKLSSLKAGETARIVSVENISLKTALSQIGFVYGAEIECILKNTTDSLVAFFICEGIFALRKKDCDMILVEKL